MERSETSPGPLPFPWRDTTLLKALAAILVANSHLEAFYPAAWLAGDGLLGNSLFYFLAGYGLVSSHRARVRSFPQWYWRRLTRLYPTVLLVVAVFALVIGGGWKHWGLSEYVRMLVWPTGFSFVQFMVPFYALFYPLLRTGKPKVFLWAIVPATVVYLVAYVPDVLSSPPGDVLRLSTRPVWIHASACFQVMMLGAFLGYRSDRSERSVWSVGSALFAVSAAYVAVKLAMFKGHGALAYPVLHVLTFAFCLFAFEWLSLTRVVEAVRRRSYLWRPTAFVGALTLEIYIVHSFIAQYDWISGARFPANIAIFWALTLPLAWLTWKVVSVIQRWLRGDVPTLQPAPAAVNSLPMSVPPSEPT